MSAMFWFIAGVSAGVAATFVAIPLWRVARGRRPLHYVVVGCGVAVFAAVAVLIYRWTGHPASLDTPALAELPNHPNAGSAATAPGAATGKAQSLESATAGLEARLARAGGSANDWTLLAQSYEFLGRTADAQRARERAAEASSARTGTAAASGGPAAGGPSLPKTNIALVWEAAAGDNPGNAAAATPALDADQLQRKLSANPRDAGAWLALANLHRQRHENEPARAAFVKVIELNGMSAQSWADYADVLGSLAGGSLAGEAGRALDRSLALDPANPKALWLKASRFHEEHRYSDALATWKTLRTVLPADSQDLQLVDANIDEATRLSGGTKPQSAADTGANTPVEISGTVTIERRLAARVERDATLFIYAKAVDAPGPPLAVMRTTANAWPVSFRLDDSMAMVPSRKLSQFDKVVIEARISHTGQAAPAPGDLYVTSDVLRPTSGKKLALVINHEIG
jgi:cytochrome c-type biogenesis protein CcmH